MLAYLSQLLNADRFAPHGYCLQWQPELIWTHVVADTLIGVSYFSIPFALIYFMAKRRDVQFGWVVWMFAVFILACGLTHFFAIWTLWNPHYGIEAIIKALTAIASVVTAIALWPLLPRAIALPSPAQLQRANDDLRLRIAERDAALEALTRETAERLRAEEMLRQAQKLEALGQLSGGFAHDFNNMLTVVLGNLDRARRLAPAEDQRLQRSLSDALSGGERAAALVEQLLSFARRQPLQPSELVAAEVVRDVGSLLERTLAPSIAIAIDAPADGWTIAADRNQAESALVNLAINAQQAMPDGGTLRIGVRHVAAGEAADAHLSDRDHVLIEVSDTGTGMPPEVVDRAFEPFFTTKPVGQGTGLGLSQVYGFVRQSSGHIVLHSETGVGTIVRIYLPRAG
jgi:signal transduction histidine kinase